MKVTDQPIVPEFSSYTTPTMAIRELRDYTQNVMGKVLTIVDASISDPRQNKAMKDLIHHAVWSNAYNELADHAHFLVNKFGKGPYPEIGHAETPISTE